MRLAQTAFSACAAICFPGLASADDFVCTDFEFVTPAHIQFVADLLGVSEQSLGAFRTDFVAARHAEGGRFFLFTGKPPSVATRECVSLAEECAPGLEALFDGELNRVGSKLDDRVLAGLVAHLPEDKREEAKSAFGPILASGAFINIGQWEGEIWVTTGIEPGQSLEAIEKLLGVDYGACILNPDCYGKFEEFVGAE